MKRRPPVLWVAIIALGLGTIQDVLVGLCKPMPGALVEGAIYCLLALGLWCGHRWAYVLTLVVWTFNMLSSTRAIYEAPLIILPVVLATRHFWPADPEAQLKRERRKFNPLVCPHCGYSLLGLTEPRCPECGEQFNVPR